MEKFLIFILVVFTLLLYATTVHVQDVLDEPFLDENINIEF